MENLVKFYPIILGFISPYFFSEFYNHPNYRNDGSRDFDFAIIKLASPVTFSDRVSPICLPSASTNYDNKVATVTGWGNLEFNGGNSDILQKVRFFLKRKWGLVDMYMALVWYWSHCQKSEFSPTNWTMPVPSHFASNQIT